MAGKKKATATRTTNPLHFEDLEPHRFEDLVRQLAYDFREWRHLEATGRLGADGGLDIRGLEVVYAERESSSEEAEVDGDRYLVATDERQWSIQCKRYKRMGPAAVRKVVAETVPDGRKAPYGLVIAAACDFSAKAMAAFREEAMNRGVREAHVWGKAALEDWLFRPEADHLLFAYFGISLGGLRKRSRLQEVRSAISIRNKLLRALDMESPQDQTFKVVLVRDMDCDFYPRVDQAFDPKAPPWYATAVEEFTVDGLVLCRHIYPGWEKADKSWDILEAGRMLHGAAKGAALFRLDQDAQREEQEQMELRKAAKEHVPEAEWRNSIRELRVIPFDSILEVDQVGDTEYGVPHLYTKFVDTEGPNTRGPFFVTSTGGAARDDHQLMPENRKPLFSAIAKKVTATRKKQAAQRAKNPAYGLWDEAGND